MKYYDDNAEEVAKRYRENVPSELYDTILKHFHKSGRSIDIGCGSGRDTDWLSIQGFDVLGVDASDPMVSEAKKYYPNVTFIADLLPELAKIQGPYSNILCSAVLMHFDDELLRSAISRIAQLAEPGASIIISYRSHDNSDGRNFYNLEDSKVAEIFSQNGCFQIESLKHPDHARNDITWTITAYRKL